MPWIKTAEGRDKYKPSIYAKEELPTWDEVYNQFYKGKIYDYDPDNPDHQELDPYWKIPRRKVLLAIICNEFNKMIFEDGFLDKLISTLRTKEIFVNDMIRDIRWVCVPIPELEIIIPEEAQKEYESHCKIWDEALKNLNVGLRSAPPIYTFPMPTGKSNPFITTYPRTDITTIDEKLMIYPIMDLDLDDPTVDDNPNYTIYTPAPNDSLERADIEIIIDCMMDEYKSYFTNGVGWKDENGKIIEREPTASKCESGPDPAL